MNYGVKNTQKLLNEAEEAKKYPWKRHRKRRIVFAIIKAILVFIISAFVVGGALAFGCVKAILDQAPDINNIDVSPTGYYSTVLNADGEVTQVLVQAGANRVFVEYEDIPRDAINAFVSIEDANYWDHIGIDFTSILRAVAGVFSEDGVTSGASTITQQLIKNNVFSGGMETSTGDKIVRKIQEQYLAVQLSKEMSKEEILENYLNTINLGNNCLGIGAAAQRYFGKEVSKLTLSEATVIAATTSNPSRYNPITHPENNAIRREIVLNNMVEQEYITEEQKQEALDDDVYDRIAAYNEEYVQQDSEVYSAFVDSLVVQVMEDLQEELGLSYSEAKDKLYSGGLTIYSTQDEYAQSVVDEEINNPDNYTESRYGITTYALSIEDEDGNVTNYSSGHIELALDISSLLFDTEEEAYEAIEAFRETVIGDNDIVLGENIDITLQPQASFVLMDQSTGYVLAISNGRGEKNSSLSLQRATSSLRQPGSVFKVVSVFAPAIDTCGQTLASVYYDEPYTVGEKSIANSWGDKYTGYSNIREGIIYSMNIVATKCLIETVSPLLAYQYAEKFGISSLVYSDTLADGTSVTDLTAAMALGGLTYGVTNLEITGAIATIANGGMYNEPLLYTKIMDNQGNVLIDKSETQDQHRVIEETTAWLLTDAMQESTQNKTYMGISATSTAAAISGMSTAGKSGTSSDTNDLWFVGFTPYYTAGIWMGYDDNGTINASSSEVKYIWRNIMAALTVDQGLEDIGFQMPSGITTATVCSRCGKLAVSGLCSSDPRGNMAVTEYFVEGSVPTETCTCHKAVNVCAVSGLLASPNCTDTVTKAYMVLGNDVIDKSASTYDSSYQAPTHTCTTCTAEEETTDEDETDGETTDGEPVEGSSENTQESDTNT